LFVGVLLVGATLFRIRGVSGDLLPIFEFRWKGGFVASQSAIVESSLRSGPTPDGASFPQFLGPNRDGVLAGPNLATNWAAQPPQVLWRQPMGAAWSGFAVAGEFAITQEQRGEEECVVAYHLRTGRQLWVRNDPAHFNTTIAGEGPRATPTIVTNRVIALGATGRLNCLELTTGRQLWSRNLLVESGGHLPDWGFACAPLVVNGLVMVHGGENAKYSLHAFRVEDGALIWSAGETTPGYASPIFAELAGIPQVLAFNHQLITAHDPQSGDLLWSRPWGNGNAVCSAPVIVSTNRVLFSSGYGYGAELFEVTNHNGRLSAGRLWKSPRLKSKFGHLFVRDGCALGLDDGVFAAIDLVDGSLRWKEGRYGHGQGLLVGELYLLMAESGELVLLRPTREAANELARFRVFNAKTWNPIALVGDLLLVRNDQEAACLRLSTSKSAD
jgi:outer membrane protein assembly factor BamB